MDGILEATGMYSRRVSATLQSSSRPFHVIAISEQLSALDGIELAQ